MAPPNQPPKTFEWCSPTVELPRNKFECIPGVEKHSHHYAVRTEAQHKTMQLTPIHSKHFEKVGGHDWELFHASHRGTVGGREFIWGMFVEGMGMFNVMVPVDHIRELTAAEREAWSKVTLGMYGSHTDKLSYTTGSGVEAHA